MVRLAYSKGYRVTEDGRVIGPRGVERKPIDNGGRYVVTVRTGKHAGSYPVPVHLLAGYQRFGEDALSSGVEVRHLDGDAYNNGEANLALGSHHDNMMDIPPNVRKEHALKGARVRRRMTLQQAEEIRAKYAQGVGYKKLCEEYHLCKSVVSYVVTGRTYVSGQ